MERELTFSIWLHGKLWGFNLVSWLCFQVWNKSILLIQTFKSIICQKLPFICSTWNVWNHCDCCVEAILFYKSLCFGKSRQISQENSVNCVSVFSEGDGGKWTPFSVKLISKSVVAVVWWSRGRCNVRKCFLNCYWLDFIFARNFLTALLHLNI